MSIDILTNHAAYENFRTSLNNHPVGFRGQPTQFTEEFLTRGFDHPRPTRVIDFSRIEWADLRKGRRGLHNWFRDSMKWGGAYGPNNIWGPRFRGIESFLDFFKERPEEFCSMIIFKLPPGYIRGDAAQFSDPGLFIRRDGIIGVATLTSGDFAHIITLVEQKENAKAKYRTAAHHLEMRMIGACLTVVRQTNFASTSRMEL